MSETARHPGEHRDLGARSASNGARPTPGPIAVLPRAKDLFVDAAREAGASVEPLSEHTRGVIWLSAGREDELRAILQANPGIEWVQLPWAGVDAFSGLIAEYAGRDLPLWTSAKGAYSEPVAEHALALTLSALRFIPAKARATSWEPVMRGTSLYGRRIVLIGAGGIAREFIRLVAPFETDITVVRRTDAPVPGAARTVTAAQLDEVLPEADVVVVAAALASTSARLIGQRQLGLMKPSAVLVNIARGGIVDTDALVAALEAGAIAGAGVDVTAPEPLPDDHPLWQAPNTVVTMHAADTPDMTGPLLATRVRSNVTAFLGEGDFVGVVDTEAGY
ncbi:MULTISPECIES: NAD(P)-dependent oxidoreductase [unclassified Diaminobutyricimonas]|uniref:NAD(P)-dependent oxidoreductase n=1 Tax=unclassified Diaminobutyricimonas TaxID=2643261 RepID=UPI001E383275|nr:MULTISPECIES: NAD(P)-dependent oxidoreductase [unclassified Diaminobutyricimonas]